MRFKWVWAVLQCALVIASGHKFERMFPAQRRARSQGGFDAIGKLWEEVELVLVLKQATWASVKTFVGAKLFQIVRKRVFRGKRICGLSKLSMHNAKDKRFIDAAELASCRLACKMMIMIDCTIGSNQSNN